MMWMKPARFNVYRIITFCALSLLVIACSKGPSDKTVVDLVKRNGLGGGVSARTIQTVTILQRGNESMDPRSPDGKGYPIKINVIWIAAGKRWSGDVEVKCYKSSYGEWNCPGGINFAHPIE